MLTRTDRRRFPVLLAVIAALAMAMLFSPVQAQEGPAPDRPRGLDATATSAQTAAVEARANSAGICDRTERVRDNIIGLLNAQDLGSLGIEDCSEVTDEHLTRIRFLDLTGGGIGGKITSLKSGDFEGLSGMRELNLEDNSLSELPEGVFDGLSSLDRLTMQGNDLGSLPEGVFDDLTNLHTLSLYDNDLAALPDGVFDGLSKLRTLAISDNKLAALSGNVFTGLGGLTHLVASNNKLTSLPDGVFSGMSKLQSVNFSGNPSAPFTLTAELERQGEDRVVVKVAAGAPFAMTVTLSAEGGTLSATTVVIGGGDTESAAVTVTPEGAGAVTVSVDSAAFPDAGTVHDGIQTGVGESLTLEAAASGICDRTAQVRDAILARLDNVSDCANVTDTDLSYLLLTLDLENSGITTLKSGDFDGLSRLNGINMSRNNLSALPDGVFDGLSRLQIINMNHNNLSALPDGVFDDLSRLFSIKLRRNNLSTLPDGVFSDLGDLQVLYLDANHLSELPPGVFDDLTNLVYLNLGQNGLSGLPADVFDELSNLVHLYLSFNNNPDPAVYPENTLDEDDLPAGAFGNLSKLRKLDLSDNNLSVLPDGWFTGLTSLVNVKLIGNPGATFTVTAELKQNGADTVVVKVTQGAPFDMLVTLSAEGGTLATTTVTVEGGSDSSGPVTVTPTGEGGTPVTVSVESVTFQNYQPEHTRGIQAGTGTSLTLNTPATGAPSISGTAQVGETLRTDTSNIEDANGLANATFSYRWVSSDGTTDTDIEKATDSTYKLVADDAGKTIKVIVTFADDGGNEETLTSAPTAVVSAAPPPPPDNVRAFTQESGAVELTWEAPQDATVTGYRIERSRADENRGGQQRSDGHPRDNHTLVEDTGSADTGYTDKSAEKGVEYEYRVSARNESGPGEGSDWVRAGPESASNAPATGALTISGTAQVGETLTAGITGIADADGLSGETFTYQWVSSDGTTDTDIEKATDSTYKLVAADKGNSIKVRVTFTDDGGNEETLTSAATGPVLGDGLPGAPRNLTATPGNKEITLSWDPPDDNGNAPATRYRIEWRVDGKDYEKNHWGTSRSTTYTTNDQANLANGVKYFFRVKAENDDGNSYGPYGPASEEVSATPTSGSAVDLGTPVLSEPEYLHHGMVQLDWQDIEDAGWYVVQYYHMVKGGEWLDLPAVGVDIAFHGSSAVVSNLHGLSWLRVRAMSCAGESEWSQIEQLFGTNKSDWEGVPVPDVEEGDEIEPCPVVLGTPVLSDTETLHHGMVRLDWQDIEDAGRYVVQYYHVKSGEWLDLPAEGVDIAFHGSSAVVSNLHGLSWLRVRAMSCTGESEWSQIEQLFGTNASDWKGVPVPDVAEGDEIEPCSEDADTSDNSPATGAPTISGTAQVGETLTADTSGITDLDGLSNVQYEYQWLADDSDISGTTNATYTLVAEDEGKAIKVEVTFTDDAGNAETLTSEATDAVKVATTTLNETASEPKAYITVVIAAGDDTVSWSDPDECTSDYNTYLNVTSGPGSGTKTRTHIGSVASGSTEATQTITYSWTSESSRPSGVELELYCGTFDASSGQNVLIASTYLATRYRALREGTYSSAPLTALSISSGTLSPAFDRGINGYTAEVPNDIEVITLDPTVLTGYQTDFVRNPGWGVIQGCGRDCNYSYGNGTTTGIVLADTDEETEGFQINLNRGQNRLGIGVNKGNMNAGPGRLYVLTVTVENSPATGLPTISGTAQVGETLTADTSGIADADGLTNATFTYQWLASRDNEIGGATDSTYTLVAADEGKTVKVRVSFTDDADNEETLTSGATDTVEAAPTTNSPATGAPTISGTAQVGETLTANTSGIADADGLDNAAFTYQWLADDEDISGATGSTYTLADDDEGKAIKVRVSFTDDAGNEEELTSGATDAVTAAPQPNSPATGAPTITGTAQVGEALTADTSGIADADGLENVSFSYEWLADDTAIQGATNSTYTLADADEGKTIKVRVSFTDDAGNEETLTSGEVGPVVSPQRIVVSPNCGQTVDFAVEAYDHEYVSLLLRKPNNLHITNFVLQRYEHDGAEFVSSGDVRRIEGELSSSLPSCSDLLWVDFIVEPNTLYKYTYELKDDSGSIVIETSLTVRTPPIPDSTGVADATLRDLTLSGIDFVPTLAAFYFVGPFLSDTVSYVGEAANSVTQTRVSPTLGHAGAGYVIMVDGVPDVDGVVPLGVGDNVITVVVTAEDDTTTRTYTITVTRSANTPATGAPTISGTAQVGETLTANTSGIADADGLSNVQYEYQWLADDAAIAGAIGSTYTPVAADEGKTIKAEVSFTDDAGNDETLTSAATDAVEAATAANSPATGAPTISGTIQVGETLTADTSGIADADGLTNVTFSYEWLSSRDTEIGGATSFTYTLVASDEGKSIKVRVSFTDDAGNDETLTSGATAAVASAPNPNSPATGAPTISGTAQVGETLTANTSGVADEDGIGNVQYEYQWLADDSDISGATNATYTLAAAEEGKAIRVQVSFTDDAGNAETLTSAATDAVATAEPSEPPDKPKDLAATATHDSVTLTWKDPGDDSITGYVILRRVRVNDQGGDFSVLVADTGSAATTYTDNTVAASTTYTYRIKAINEHGVSERSRWVHIDTPAPPVPDQPTGLEATASHGQVVLTWDDPEDDSITGYVILRRVRVNDTGGDFSVLVANTESAATTYADNTVAASTTYTYRIKAINEHGTSERSRWYHISTPAAP